VPNEPPGDGSGGVPDEGSGQHSREEPAERTGDVRPAGLQVPDDARALDRDVRALRRERRARARRSRLLGLVTRGPGSRVGVPAGLVVAALTVVALFAALPVLLRPAGVVEPPRRPLAAPAVAPGQVGGLLPDVPLRAGERTLPVRSAVRAGVLVLVPPACGCDELVHDVVAQALEFTRNVRLVVDGRVPGAEREAVRLRAQAVRGLARSAVDPTGALVRAYAPHGVTVLPVAGNGVVLHVLRDVRPEQRLEAQIDDLAARP
jgi:hypothetical protein